MKCRTIPNTVQVQYRPLLLRSILIASVLVLAHCGNKLEFPKKLLGRYTTVAARYEDRYIEITEKFIIFGTGADVPNMYVIQKVQQKENGRPNEFTFLCHNSERAEFLFILYVEETNDGLILRLNNPRQVIWRKILNGIDKSP